MVLSGGTNRKHAKTLAAIFAHPVPANLRWSYVEALLASLGADISERAGSRIAEVLFEQVQV
ncbi:MAG: type II toxin-antitoxin system HicA family toxin [Acidobacteria bacterium]|nr:MAG: type II toxin-antitoxin system HicA family toxin [Acidobacteriota bacterium]